MLENKPKSLRESIKKSTRHRTVPIPTTIEKLKDYKTLIIFKMSASPFWYFRFYNDGKVIKKSTQTSDKASAITIAKTCYHDFKGSFIQSLSESDPHQFRLAQIRSIPQTRLSEFALCAQSYLKEVKIRVDRGELSALKLKFEEARIRQDFLPFFGHFRLKEINYRVITAYINQLSTPARPLKIGTLKVHLSHIRTTLTHAHRMELISSMPAFPTLRRIDSPRPWFNPEEFQALCEAARDYSGQVFMKVSTKGEQLRNIKITLELLDLIQFMTKTFIRPTDIRVLKHKHITIVRNNQPYLRLSHPATKSHGSPVVSMPSAVSVYDGIVARQQAIGFGNPEDYVFQPEHENRDYAMRSLQRQFDQALLKSGLKKDPRGENRSLYSLRHTSIMFRLIYGDGLSPMLLARNARTSVEMVDRFYGKHLGPEMNVAALHRGSEDGIDLARINHITG